MNQKLVRILLSLVFLMSFGSMANDREMLNKQHPEADQLQVHTLGQRPEYGGESFLERYGPPENITEHGGHFDDVFAYVSWGVLIFFLAVVFGVVGFGWMYRSKPGRKAFYTTGLAEKKFTMVLDILFFITMDCYLIYFSVYDTKRFLMTVPQGPEVVEIQVMPQQWVWNFRYKGADGVFNTPDDIVTVNEMWVPNGKQVSLQIKSKDVIHGFMVPNVRRQVDAIPGQVSRIWFKPIKDGTYEIACMHLCGTAHYKMKGFMKVVDESDYQNWSREMSEWSAAKYDPDDARTHWGWQWGI
ncbi:hypothetical protein GW915_10405 [bacterium]|nr:hypothetical protein [bacterium]